MSFADTNRSSWRDGAILSRPTSARRSGTSAPAEPPLWAHASNSVITVPTKTSFSTPAASALAPSASPEREINGWPQPLRSYCRCPTPMSLSLCRTSFRCWPSRIHAGCITSCSRRFRKPCSLWPPTRAASEPTSASWRCYTPGTNRFVRILTSTAWFPPVGLPRIVPVGSAPLARDSFCPGKSSPRCLGQVPGFAQPRLSQK